MPTAFLAFVTSAASGIWFDGPVPQSRRSSKSVGKPQGPGVNCTAEESSPRSGHGTANLGIAASHFLHLAVQGFWGQPQHHGRRHHAEFLDQRIGSDPADFAA